MYVRVPPPLWKNLSFPEHLVPDTSRAKTSSQRRCPAVGVRSLQE